MNDRVGQVWVGDRVLLIMWRDVANEYTALNLETGELEAFFTRHLEENANWERIA